MLIKETMEGREKENMHIPEDENIQKFSFSKSVSLPKEYYSIDKPKQHIAKSIKYSIEQQKLSLRKLSSKIDGMSYTQISRVTRKENYNIDTLLKILDALNLELVIQQKKET
ncbi:helix-turn-helix domain-containing protein [Rossellomorea marisflavi]|uniref:helix-turn-helix domain-containing protein n=1 Tax=Rossellomorea marisflavi TaxID=189381 RepID=UPI00345AEBE3